MRNQDGKRPVMAGGQAPERLIYALEAIRSALLWRTPIRRFDL